ncbi:hypothetical protein [endosymbiont of Lamellibrachia barhami]|uniref:hypothetical protein n=1 Tax=endosymbiont of Lamellibrachia barhami TaxID=205975 RepID=UPI0015BF4797|nr:hypothetical protein [endosymbiont of Lamellibrachia barhami]
MIMDYQPVAGQPRRKTAQRLLTGALISSTTLSTSCPASGGRPDGGEGVDQNAPVIGNEGRARKNSIGRER